MYFRHTTIHYEPSKHNKRDISYAYVCVWHIIITWGLSHIAEHLMCWPCAQHLFRPHTPPNAHTPPTSAHSLWCRWQIRRKSTSYKIDTLSLGMGKLSASWQETYLEFFLETLEILTEFIYQKYLYYIFTNSNYIILSTCSPYSLIYFISMLESVLKILLTKRISNLF